MHVITSITDEDGAMHVLPPERVVEELPSLSAPGVQETFDTEEDAEKAYAEYRPTTLFLFTADCHIKGRTWTNSTLLQKDAYNAFEKFISDANQIGPMDGFRDLVIGGDLFDNNRPSSQDLYVLSTQITHIPRTFYIRGNHDSVEPAYIESVKDRHESPAYGQVIELYSDLMKDDDKLALTAFYRLSNKAFIAGISWMPSDTRFVNVLRGVVAQWRRRKKEGQILYLVLHCCFKHLLAFEGAYQLDLDMIKEICGNDQINILVGHIHTRDITVYNAAGAYIHSPGSLYPLSSDKMGDPCFGSLIDADTGKIIDVPTNVRKYVTVNIRDTGDNIIEYLNGKDLKPADWRELPTFVDLVVPEDYDKPIALPETEDYIFKIDRQLTSKQITPTATGQVYTINDAVREELQNEANRDMVIEMAEELLASDDPVGTLEEWLTFWNVRKATC